MFLLCNTQDYLLNCWEEPPFVAHILHEEITAVSWLQSTGMVNCILVAVMSNFASRKPN